MADVLPIDDILPDLIAALAARGMAVLEAPPKALVKPRQPAPSPIPGAVQIPGGGAKAPLPPPSLQITLNLFKRSR